MFRIIILWPLFAVIPHAGILGRLIKLVKSLMIFSDELKRGFLMVQRVFKEVRKYPDMCCE